MQHCEVCEKWEPKKLFNENEIRNTKWKLNYKIQQEKCQT